MSFAARFRLFAVPSCWLVVLSQFSFSLALFHFAVVVVAAGEVASLTCGGIVFLLCFQICFACSHLMWLATGSAVSMAHAFSSNRLLCGFSHMLYPLCVPV